MRVRKFSLRCVLCYSARGARPCKFPKFGNLQSVQNSRNPIKMQLGDTPQPQKSPPDIPRGLRAGPGPRGPPRGSYACPESLSQDFANFQTQISKNLLFRSLEVFVKNAFHLSLRTGSLEGIIGCAEVQGPRFAVTFFLKSGFGNLQILGGATPGV